MEIKNFAELVEPYLQLHDKTIKVTSYSTSNLVQNGDNYGSVILAVQVKLSNGETKQLVAKLNPPTELFKKIFNISIAFKKEAELYSVIVPILHNFQSENNVEALDIFPKSYGHRLSLSTKLDVFDEDACFVMENLRFEGFAAMKRHDLFDLPTAVYFMRMLAHFHALPIAIKKKKPEAMETIKKHLPLNYTDPEICQWHSSRVWQLVNHFLHQDPELVAHASRIENLWQHSVKQFIEMNVLGSEPFNTITHNDIWLTNILFKCDGDKKPVANKLVDYQMAAYGNPGNDIIFFVHSSVQPDVISEDYDKLIDIYFEEFINKLKAYKVNTEAFTKEAFLKEMESAAKCMQLYHALFMSVNIFLELKKDQSTENILTDDLVTLVGDKYVKQFKVIVMNWIKHNWV